jgi:hypothetical protein
MEVTVSKAPFKNDIPQRTIIPFGKTELAIPAEDFIPIRIKRHNKRMTYTHPFDNMSFMIIPPSISVAFYTAKIAAFWFL